MKKRAQKDKRAEHHFHDLELGGAKLLVHRDRAFGELRIAKKCAWHMVRDYLAAINKDQSCLLTLVREHGYDDIDAWLDHWFAPITDFGDDYIELIQAVQGGMTLDRYLASAPAAFLHGKKRIDAEGKVKRSAPIPSDPSELLSSDERCEVWRAQAMTAKTRYRLVEREVTALRKQLAGVHKEMRRLNKILAVSTAAA